MGGAEKKINKKSKNQLKQPEEMKRNENMKQFILGLGAQKSGTTWLYDYIISNESFRRSAIKPKELHVWDCKEIPEFFPKRRKAYQTLNVSRYHLWRMERSDEYYFDYFSKLLKNGGIAVDITPSYSGLSVTTLQKIQDGFAARGVPVKCVFLMRDPVMRCVSGFGHNKVRAKPGEVRMGVSEAKEIDAAFSDYTASESCQFRTRYEVTMDNATKAFGTENFRAFLYEEIFKGNALKDVAEFLGLPNRSDFLKKKSNVARKSYDFDESSLEACAKFYADTYHRVAETHPISKELWTGWRYLN